MMSVSRWLLTQSLVAGVGAACVWAFSPSQELIPLLGVGFALCGSIAAFWQLFKVWGLWQ